MIYGLQHIDYHIFRYGTSKLLNYSFHFYVSKFLKQTVTHIAVPTFFVISGFLFFQKLNEWDWGIYRNKLRSRAKTLLLPYLCWITISYLSIGGISAIEALLNGSSLQEAWNTFMDHRYSLICSYWGIEYTQQFPDWFGNDIKGYSNNIVPTLWFVRNLIVVTIMSPLFYFFVKKIKIYGMALLGICYLSNHDFDMTSLFYYGTGAFLAINNKSIVSVAKKIGIPALIIAIVSLVACTYYAGRGSLYGFRLYPIYVLSGVWSAFYIASYLVERKNIKPNKFLVQSCFFVYAFHYLRFTEEWDPSLISYSYNVISRLFYGVPHVELLQFLIPPIITIVICLALFWLLRKMFPRICGILTGNRANA